ncbi:MAG TPA: Ig-like domain-containing protein [Vicinamibacterales bacterium]|nr:Ig-like domain-containing protein [Vicinamibacterales bacterium]
MRRARIIVAVVLAAALAGTLLRSGGVGHHLRKWTSAKLDAQSSTITRGPYLQLGTPSSIVVRWRTATATDSQVVYGPDPANLIWSATIPTATTEHEVALTSLVPNTKYFYAVGSSSVRLEGGDSNHFFLTSPAPGTPIQTRVWVLGDSGTSDANAASVRDAFYAFNGSTPTNLWLMLGDNAYNGGTDAEYQAAVFDMFPATLRQSVLWPTIGNHDIANTSLGTGPYYDIFTLPKNAQAGGLASGTEAYYSFDYGNIHFICLDSFDVDLTAGSPMMTWLQNDLASTSQRWIIAYWHHPPYSKGSHDSDVDYELTMMRQNANPLLEAAGVDLVLSGHSHSYERSFLIDGHYGTSSTFTNSMKVDGGSGREDGTGAYRKPNVIPSPHAGAVYTVAGSSGFNGGGPLNYPAMFVSLNVLGSLVLDVNDGRLDAHFVDNTSTVRDYFTILKDPLTPLSITTASLPDGAVGAPYSQTLAAAGGNKPYTWSLAAGSLPAGVSLASATGVISGTPSAAGAATFTVQAVDHTTPGMVAQRQLSMTIAPAPTISALSPASGMAGTSVTISGLNFRATQGTSSVQFNGTIASTTNWTDTTITAKVPAGAASGPVVVTVLGAASNGVTFTVSAPTVTTLTPNSGPAGTAVTIGGANFGSAQGTSTVTFNGLAASPSSWSDTSITVPVPSTATTGPVVVIVNGVSSNSVAFTVSAAMSPPARVGAQIAGAFADATGHSAQSHLVFAANAGVWWLFTLSSAADSQGGTNHVVKAFHSSGPNLATSTWTAAADSPGASTAVSQGCPNCFMGGGRALGVAYINNNPVDVVHAEIAMAYDGQDGLVAHVRATVTATGITWGAWNYHDEPAAIWTLPRGVAVGISGSKYVHSAGPLLQQEVDANARKSTNADTGSTWTTGFSAVSVIDNSMIRESNALAFAPLAGDAMLAVYDNGGGASCGYGCVPPGSVSEPNLTNLGYKKSNGDGSWPAVPVGSQAPGDGNVFATAATIDQNDWALVSVDATTVYVFRRNAAGTGVDAASYNGGGNTWTSMAAPPPFGNGQAFKSGAGLFGATDGLNVWLFVINTDAANAILSTQYNGTGWSAWAAVPGTDSGSHSRQFIAGWSAVAANQIGLTWTEGTTSYDVFTAAFGNILPDMTPPTVAVTAPSDGASVSGTVSVTASASDNVSVAGVQFKLDNVNVGAEQTTSPYSIAWNTVGVANGPHNLTAVARDSSNNTATSAVVTVTVTNDTAPPAVSITAPVDGTAVSGTTAVTAAATDNVGVAGVQFTLDSANFGSEVTASPYTITWDTTTTPNGSHALSAIARDAAGNKTTAAAVTVIVGNVDSTPPTISMTAPANGATASGTNVTISAKASDNVGVVGVQFLLDSAPLGAEVVASPYTLNWNSTTTANGTHTLAARARDSAGNQATAPAVTVTVSNVVSVPPAIDAVKWIDRSSRSSTLATGTFSTTSGNELLLAFISTDWRSGPNTTVKNVAGAGLTWVLVQRTNVQSGSAEIWRAFAPTALANVTVTATLSQAVVASMTVVSFTNVDTSGTNGSGAIGATASGNSSAGAPSATLVTTRNNSIVLGVGTDWDGAITRTLDAGQTMVHQYLASVVGDTYWVQRTTTAVAAVGTTVTIGDTAPSDDRYNLSICEIRGPQ